MMSLLTISHTTLLQEQLDYVVAARLGVACLSYPHCGHGYIWACAKGHEGFSFSHCLVLIYIKELFRTKPKIVSIQCGHSSSLDRVKVSPGVDYTEIPQVLGGCAAWCVLL